MDSSSWLLKVYSHKKKLKKIKNHLIPPGESVFIIFFYFKLYKRVHNITNKFSKKRKKFALNFKIKLG